ncbi:MAG: tetratricopeptide repeat protein, partial [candidate division WOR-3 bacterium]
GVSRTTTGAFAAALCAVPGFGLVTNFGLCDQSRNYTAHEHAVNLFRTVSHGSTLFLDGDNNVFPAAYGRIVEGMGDGITLYDRHNIIFRWRLPTYPFVFAGTWDELESTVIREILHSESGKGVYFAAMNPFAVSLPQEYRLAPCGILRKVVPAQREEGCSDDIWNYYCTESYHDSFHRDYMNREVASQFYFRKGQSLWLSGRRNEAMLLLNLASRIGYNDTSIHSDLGVFFTDQGMFEEARKELEMALIYYDDLSGIYNNWGYFWHKKGDPSAAIDWFKKAIDLSPRNTAYHNNLGFVLYQLGREAEARQRFETSLSIHGRQPHIKDFMVEHGLH